MKYTSGQFKTGFGKDGVEGETTFTQVGATGRVYLPLEGDGPLTLRFRLKPTFDETPYNANARVILRALKTHGMILSDGGNIALTFADDRLSAAKWSGLGITPQTFNSIRVTDFEVVDLGAEIPLTFNCVRAP